MPDENEAREEAAIEAERAEQEAFEARFPLEKFAGIAEALRLPPDLETISALRRILLPEFRFFVECCPGATLSREDQIGRLENLRDTANALHRSLGPGGARLLLPRAMWGPKRVNDQFCATIRALADVADAQIQRLRSSRSRGGRPAKDAFRQFSADLVRLYERETVMKAERPDWKGGNKYRGRFYEFVIAVAQCLRDCISEPEILEQLPKNEGAIGDGLRKHWDDIVRTAGEKPSSSEME